MKEDQYIELKESWRDEYLKHICAFANTHGGSLYVGIRDDGKPVGINKIFNVCKKKGLKEPLIEEIAGGVSITFFNQSKTTSKNSGGQADKIVEIIDKRPTATAREIAGMLGLSEYGVRYHLKKLKKANVLQYIGSSKNGYWKVVFEDSEDDS